MPGKQMEMLYREMHRRMSSGDGEGASMIERMMLEMDGQMEEMRRVSTGSASIMVRTDSSAGNVLIRLDDIDCISEHKYDSSKSVVRLCDGTHVIACARMDEVVAMARDAERRAIAGKMENALADNGDGCYLNGESCNQ